MILDKDVLVNNILTEISDNSTGQISPYDIRHNLLDIIDSVHLLTIGKPLTGSNFGTPNTRSTRVGEDALAKIDLAGYFSIDNTAVGYSSLKSNYQGINNTAIGSHSLFCNIYGENNLGAGYSSLGGNTTGHGNVGLGNYTLNNNKGGNFNIAIGHGAGYYASDTDNKLFIASHAVDSEYVCDNPSGSGLIPLVYGDLTSLKFGIATNSLHSDGSLQVNGNITPSVNDSSNLGSLNYGFSYLFLTSGIFFDNNLYIGQSNAFDITVKGNVQPQSHNTYSLGSQANQFLSAYINNLYVSGVATINRINAIENCNFFSKTLNLASSGQISIDGGGPSDIYEYANEYNPISSFCGYLSDIDLTGAGLNIDSSGNSYIRKYTFTYSPPNQSLTYLQTDTPFSRSAWNSNISLHLDSGRHLLTDRIIFPSSINVVNASNGIGIFTRSSGLFFSKNELIPHTLSPSGYLAGVGDVNFYATSGDNSDYIINFCVPDSGVTIKHRLLTGIKKKSLDNLNNNADKLSGFEFQYIDNPPNYVVGARTDRLIIGSYDNTSLPINALTILRNNDDEGIVGITNLSPNSKNILPNTSLNIRSANNAIARLTAENNSNTKSAIQLLGGENCLENGFEAAYLNGSGLADLSMYTDSGKEVYVRFYEGIDSDLVVGNDLYRIGILNSVSGSLQYSNETHGMVSIGSQTNNYASISMRSYTKNGTVYSDFPTLRPTPVSNRGIFFVGNKVKSNQTHSMFMIDGSGNAHDLIINKFDVTDGRGLFTDPSGNTFGGLFCPKLRDFSEEPATTRYWSNNTGIGSGVLFSIVSGVDNTVFGTQSLKTLTNGSRNTVIGSRSASTVSAISNDNIVIGCAALTPSGNISNPVYANRNIIIGNNISLSGIVEDTFILGHGSDVLLAGKLGPTSDNKYISMPRGGRFFVNDNTNTDALQIRANYIDVIDRGGNNYPNNTLTFTFSGNNVGELLYLSHAADPMTNSAVYQSPAPARPYAQLEGDLKVRGSIRFSDFTSLSSASFLNNISTLENQVANHTTSINNLFGSFVEGYVHSKIEAPSNGNLPTSGNLHIKNQNWADNGTINLVNRDTTSIIHSGAYVIAIKVNNEFRPLWISASDTKCQCCK